MQPELAECAEILGDEKEDPTLKTFVCFYELKKRILGVAQYRGEDLTLVVGSVWMGEEVPHSSLLQDAETSQEERAVVERLLVQLRPDLVVLSSEQLSLQQIMRDYEQGATSVLFEVEKKSTFAFAFAKQQLLSVQLGTLRNKNLQERTNALSSLLDLTDEAAVCAAGGLLSYIDRKKAASDFDSSVQITPVNQIIRLTLEGSLCIDRDSYSSLQIFKLEAHPSVHSLGSPKEGLSLFGIFKQKICSQVGRRMLRHWFLTPTQDSNVINERLNTVAFFLATRKCRNGKT
eukprot:TRINITY_DN5012_c0_g1_i14.p2 TRINITY_DN5012_c0_g1~~TRINITY_DN5012_c0_g1_i14.p2  ORF type:complete len:289 (+),score=41.83 TRINITY_DN5012_c0_g1_i14:261-1127(+)